MRRALFPASSSSGSASDDNHGNVHTVLVVPHLFKPLGGDQNIGVTRFPLLQTGVSMTSRLQTLAAAKSCSCGEQRSGVARWRCTLKAPFSIRSIFFPPEETGSDCIRGGGGGWRRGRRGGRDYARLSQGLCRSLPRRLQDMLSKMR
jgi:hypothetical protein